MFDLCSHYDELLVMTGTDELKSGLHCKLNQHVVILQYI